MSKFQWTVPQQHCITARGGDVLVSAAAGSGKTAVLIERVIERLTDSEHPLDIDRLLIVTFTKAAAAEMKQRLSARLTELLADDPDNTHLLRQQMLLPSAMITTIDGFCTAVLREYFDKAGLSPRFGIADEHELKLMRSDALDETLEIFYAAAEDGFLALCDLVNGARDDSGIKAVIENIYDTIQAQAFPMDWLRDNTVTLGPTTPLAHSAWGKTMRRFAGDKLRLLAELAENAAAPLYDITDAAAYADRLRSDITMLTRAALLLQDEGETWDAMARAVDMAVPANLPASKKIDALLAENVKATWTLIREEIRKKILPLFAETEQDARAHVEATAPKLQALCDLVETFTAHLDAKKRAKNLLDFADLEHLTLQLLYDHAANAPTPLAAEIGARFTEIMVDEFQDSNRVQDTMFSMLKTDSNTLFFVGDVKQSIYGFRQACPQLFLEKKDSAAPYDGKQFPACITLGENFRSRHDVTGTVNFVFDSLMTKDTCGIEYQKSERLQAGATYPAADSAAELLLMDNPFAGRDLSAHDVEALAVATRIKELLAHGQVTENGVLRPVQYGDICILLRKRSDALTAYAETLQNQGIPIAIDTAVPFFESTEIMTATALLQTIDNPLRDVSLMAVLLSPLVGMTADDCAKIRIQAKEISGKTVHLYTALTLVADGAHTDSILKQKVQNILARLRRYRRLAVSLSVENLLSRIYEETPLLYTAGANTQGAARLDNLRHLAHMARTLSATVSGLSAFVRHLDRLQAEGIQVQAPHSAATNNAVQIMTMHGAKGLEFPIVFLGNLFGEFHRETVKQTVFTHATAGVALSGYDRQTLTAFPTVSQNGVRTAERYTDMEEELRVLYVAMTRAKEKLIMVGVKKNLPARIQKLAVYLPKTPHIDSMRMLSLNCYADWLLLCFLRHPDGVYLRGCADGADIPVLESEAPLICRVMQADELESDTVQTADIPTQNDLPQAVEMRARMAYTYPFTALQSIPAKMAASALAHRETAADFVAISRPSFLSDGGMTPAERGTAMHTFMQYADYAAAAENVTAEKERLYHDGFLSAAQRDVLDETKLAAFFGGDLYARITRAPRVWRELAFTMPIAAGSIDESLSDAAAKETVIVQGIADCVFEEGGGIVIVDYKTDRVQDDTVLSARYKKQLEIYRTALQDMLGLPVKETLLYAFHTGHTVKI